MKNAEFYTRAALDQPGKPKRKDVIKWKQVLAIAALLVFFAPFIPSRRHPFQARGHSDWFDYLEKAGYWGVAVCAILFAIFLYERLQFTSPTYHYKLVGIFAVSEKIPKPKKRIRLEPGTDHLVSVNTDLFHRLTIGDKVQVECRLTGEVIAIRKVAG